MSDVNETLQDLMERRLKELGKRRGRGESISLREAWQRLPVDENGDRRPTYETFRRIRQAGHSNISDETADALATMLDVPVDDVLVAAGQRRRLGRFELPRRADRLTKSERDAVIGIIDAILEAGSRTGRVDYGFDRTTDVLFMGSGKTSDFVQSLGRRLVRDGDDVVVIGATDELMQAARTTASGALTAGQRRRREADAAGEENQDPGDHPS